MPTSWQPTPDPHVIIEVQSLFLSSFSWWKGISYRRTKTNKFLWLSNKYRLDEIRASLSLNSKLFWTQIKPLLSPSNPRSKKGRTKGFRHGKRSGAIPFCHTKRSPSQGGRLRWIRIGIRVSNSSLLNSN